MKEVFQHQNYIAWLEDLFIFDKLVIILISVLRQ